MLKRRLKEPFGKAGLTVAICALVLATTGAAFAVSKLSGPEKKEVEKIAKKYAGKPGAPGAAGSNGTNGKDGASGTNGKDGTNGKSVTVSGTAAGCAEGGATVQVAGEPATAQQVCNGEEGEEGSPWTAGGTLPSEQTETGSWIATSNTGEAIGGVDAAISFPIPLQAALPASKVHYIVGEPTTGTGNLTENSKTVASFTTNSGGFVAGQEISGTGIPPQTMIAAVNNETETLTLTAKATASGSAVSLSAGTPPADSAVCTGTVAAPAAVKGNLCVYANSQVELNPAVTPPLHVISQPAVSAGSGGANTSGAILTFLAQGSPPRSAYGTWAVTAP